MDDEMQRIENLTRTIASRLEGLNDTVILARVGDQWIGAAKGPEGLFAPMWIALPSLVQLQEIANDP